MKRKIILILISIFISNYYFIFVQSADDIKLAREKEKEWKEKKAQLEKAVFDGDFETAKNLIFFFADEQTIRNLKVILDIFKKIKDVSLYWNIIALLSEKEDVYDETAKKRYYEAITDFILKNKNKFGIDLMYLYYWQPIPTHINYVKRIFSRGSTGQKIFALEILKKHLGKKLIRLLLYLRFKKYPSIPKSEDKHALYFTIKKLILEISGGIDFDTLGMWEDFLKSRKNRRELGKKRNVVGPAILKEEGKFSTIASAPRKILVVFGSYDPQLSNVLKDMGIEFEVKPRLDQLDKKTLEKVDVIFIGCGAQLPVESGYQYSTTNKKDVKESKKESTTILLRNFVSSGGYIFAEDLGLADVLEKVFPGYVTAGESQQVGTYGIFPNIGFGLHPLLLDVFSRPLTGGDSPLKWKVDMTPVYTILYDENKVSPIIYSPTFGGNNILGVTFFYPGMANQAKICLSQGFENPFFVNGGRVLYLTSHFGKQPKELDGYALQQLVLNFVYEARLKQKRHIFLPDTKKRRK